jgi:pyrophosphatase PpaX
MRPYSAYLFDADGTLIDTTELIYQCFVHTIRRFGNREIARPDVVKHIGLTLRDQMEVYFGKLDDERFGIMADAHMEYQLSIYPRYLRAFPGIAETLAALKAAGRKLAVVTSRRSQTLIEYLRVTGLITFFDALVTPENTIKSKPDPEPARTALALLGKVSARDALFIGDSIYDMRCGVDAGTDTAFVLWSHNDPDALAVRPTYLIGRASDLLVERQG